MKKKSKYKSDIEFSRETYYDLILKGREGIEEMIEVCRQTEHPRAYEVLAKLIKEVGETNDKMLDIYVKQENMKTAKVRRNNQLTHETKVGTINQFIASTEDLQRMLLKDPEVIDVTPEKEDERT